MVKFWNSRILEVILHTLVWAILFSLSVLFFPGHQFSFDTLLRINWTFLLFAAVIFYLNHFVLVDAFVFRKKTLWFILINIGLIVLFTWLNNFIVEVGPPPHMSKDFHPGGLDDPHRDDFMRPDANFMFLRSAGTYIVPIIISLTLKVLVRLNKVEMEKKEIKAEQVRSELIHLKHQLNPHFFFNALNSIYSLIDLSPKKSKEAIHGLAKLVRYLLYHTESEFVLLSQEVDFLTQYIHLMQLRLDPKTKVHLELEILSREHKIAPLLFLPLIENTFKHGVLAKENGDIHIALRMRNHQVELTTTNPIFPENENRETEKGIGIENLKKRLKLLYPGHYLLEQKIQGNLFLATLRIDLTPS